MTRTLSTPRFTGRGPLPETGDPFGDGYQDPTPATPVEKFDATHKQIMFLVKLASERGMNLIGIVCEATPSGEILFTPEGSAVPKITKRAASKGIDEFLRMPKATPPAAPAPPVTPRTPAQEITEGMYRNPKTGEIFKVQRAVHGSGHLYAKRLVVETADEDGAPAECYFEMARGMIYKLRPEWKLTLEEAKAFGALYGTCCVCARTLTDEKSIAAGIGPICASKF